MASSLATTSSSASGPGETRIAAELSTGSIAHFYFSFFFVAANGTSASLG